MATWLLIFPLTSFSLGVWQVFRWRGKESLIAERESKLRNPPAPLPSYQEITADRDKLNWRLFYVSGEFQNQNELFLGPRYHEGDVGWHIYTPFVRYDIPGETIFVNRGWIPKDYRDPKTRRTTYVEGPTQLAGLLRPISSKSILLPMDNDPATNQWIWPDLPKMKNNVPSSPALVPLAIDEIAPVTEPKNPLIISTNNPNQQKITVDMLPVKEKPVVNLPNSHLGYIITWWTLTACLIPAWLWRRRQERAPIKPFRRRTPSQQVIKK